MGHQRIPDLIQYWKTESIDESGCRMVSEDVGNSQASGQSPGEVLSVRTGRLGKHN